MAPPPTTANELRRSFTGFFAARDHTVVPSASLIPHDPTVLFTVAGMVPFKAYFTGDETPPFRRATDVQKCVRAGGKHNDLDDVGRTRRHLVFFEMMGNWSFGDYFKELAIPWAWEYVTEDLGFDGDRIWITVHTSDDEAEQIWHDVVGVPMERIQRLGDKDNFWQMGDTGPCGPCSELHIDRGPSYGPDGGPLADPAGERFMEFWNLVFMQYDQAPGRHADAAAPAVDRHRRGPGAHPDPAPGGRLRLGHRRAAAHHRGGVLAHRPRLRPRRAHRRQPAHPGRARPLGHDARQRRRLPLQRGPGLRPAPHPAPGRPPRLPARRRQARHARPGRGVHRGDGRGLPRRGQEPRLHHRRDHPGGGAVPPDAADRPHHPRGRAVAPARRSCPARPRSSSTTPSASRWR